MYKSLVLLAVCLVIIEARPAQYLPAIPGYVPVYIQNGDTPLEEINPELAEAFHALPAGRSAGKLVEAAPESLDLPENSDLPKLSPVYGSPDDESISSAEIKPENLR